MDVGTWLRNLGLGQYEAAFRDNSVDADILPRLTAEDLKELGIGSVGHRRMLLDAIAELRSATLPFAAPTEAPAPRLRPSLHRRTSFKSLPNAVSLRSCSAIS